MAAPQHHSTNGTIDRKGEKILEGRVSSKKANDWLFGGNGLLDTSVIQKEGQRMRGEK